LEQINQQAKEQKTNMQKEIDGLKEKIVELNNEVTGQKKKKVEADNELERLTKGISGKTIVVCIVLMKEPYEEYMAKCKKDPGTEKLAKAIEGVTNGEFIAKQAGMGTTSLCDNHKI
jgi:hypothetical protein